MKSALVSSLIVTVALTLVTGAIYPFAVTMLASWFFPTKASGSLIDRNGHIAGSEWIGQPFSNVKYFWGRPSATAPVPYNSMAGSGSNLSLTNPAWNEAVRQRIDALHNADPGNEERIPIDLVTASASGLDPHISPRAAEYQVRRVAKARGLTDDVVRRLVRQNTEPPQFGFLGQHRVHVLRLNLDLDRLSHE